ncbi:hypothetical protein [Hymenobacter lapidiphilus]|uniref:Uncharacterized protein n=1 Tax=Hymenobacter lapidiphilus TaxID=2608003 RepID=A0A7Y7PLW9_9BACT|nr:hypothetical protein [Hymenobacter lapidiphilus]NVO30213.1 hypothetical protein [Hymenobacter lapidiphilus]
MSSCQKEDDPQPGVPEAEVEMQRATTYLSTSRFNNEQGYSQKTLQSTATLATDKLQLDFDAIEGKDAISFTVPRSSLTTAFVGVYELRTLASHAAPVASVYTFFRSRAAGSINSTTYRNMRGQLTITGYDAQRQLLAGSYQAQLENVADPADDNGASGDALRCNVEITGSFTNLKVQ